MASKGPIALTLEFLHRIRKRDPTDDILSELRGTNVQQLLSSIPDDASKKAFWLNLYNGCSFKAIKESPKRLASLPRKLIHFNTRKICVAGHLLSLNDIEHGMLRRSQIWWSKGYLKKPFPSAFERTARVSQLDPRIHFALNCGAVSCPPVHPYHPESVNEDLERVTMDFLSTEMKEKGDEIWVSSLFNMYRGDFGGKKGILRFLESRSSTRSIKDRRIRFLPYDWTPDTSQIYPERS